MSKTLKVLLSKIGIETEDNQIIEGISCDSRDIKENWLFVAVKGNSHHGDEFIKEVLDNRAFVISENQCGVNCFRCEDCKAALAVLINEYYDYPSDQLMVIGISGTNGKTSVAALLKQLFEKWEKRCIVIGTNGIEYGTEFETIENTTPGIMDCLRVFLRAKKENWDILVMEVSSHAIAEKRIGFIRFDWLIYTNITQDHLDYHKTFAHYQATKFKARFYLKENGRIIIDNDRKELHELKRYLPDRVITVGQTGDFKISAFLCLLDKTFLMINETIYQCDLIGENNARNLALAIALLSQFNYPDLVLAIKELHVVEGRMELLKIQGWKILIDYAHTPAALKNLLLFARKSGNVICVIGCGGERDQGKRHKMGTIASLYSQLTIFTEDNSRNEKIDDIILAMSENILNNVIIEKKRQSAIRLAFKMASKEDVIVVAGKGNEQFLIVNGTKIPYNDKAFIIQLLKGEFHL